MSKTDLQSKTKSELLKIAQRLGLRGISTMNKPELVTTIVSAKSSRGAGLKTKAVALAQKATEAIKRRAVRKRAPIDPPKPAPKRKAAGKPGRSAKPKTDTAAKREAVAGVAAAEELSAHKFDVTPGPKVPKQVFQEEYLGELPEAYGTGRLFLTARDPHWLFAYWDFTGPQMEEARRRATDGRLVLRVFEKNHAAPVQELTLHPESRNWYIPAPKATTTYYAQLGFWQPGGHFHVLSQSRETTTPPAQPSADTTARFATIPVDIHFNELLEIIRAHLRDGERLADALHRLQSEGYKFPFQVGVTLGPWSAQQTAALEKLVGGDVLRRIHIGSVELTEWLRRRLQEETSSGMFSGFSPAGASWSGQPQRGFWFAVNAELIIYGATEPDATVTLDGQPVKLRSDGTFSFHYAFPDGQYRLPVVAVSARGDDQRAVDLQFERRSQTRGQVGKVKPPAHLKAPQAP
jgi:hypothetical protein